VAAYRLTFHPIELGRLAYPGLPSDIRQRHAVRTLLDNGCRLGIPKFGRLHGLPLVRAHGDYGENSKSEQSSFSGPDKAPSRRISTPYEIF